MSKGHAGAAVYAALATAGFFPEEKLRTHCQDGSDLSGHVSHKGVPGVEFSTGSLGHGLSVSAGMAYSQRLRGVDCRVFCLARAMVNSTRDRTGRRYFSRPTIDWTSSCIVIDYNKIQSLATVSETLALEPLAAKFDAFGWEVRETDGHDHGALRLRWRHLKE